MIQGFQESFRRHRRNDRYGGVMIYVNSNIICKRQTYLKVYQIKCIGVECMIYINEFLIVTLNRPPNLNLIAYSMEKAKNETKTNIATTLITGDLNENLLDS